MSFIIRSISQRIFWKKILRRNYLCYSKNDTFFALVFLSKVWQEGLILDAKKNCYPQIACLDINRQQRCAEKVIEIFYWRKNNSLVSCFFAVYEETLERCWIIHACIKFQISLIILNSLHAQDCRMKNRLQITRWLALFRIEIP